MTNHWVVFLLFLFLFFFDTELYEVFGGGSVLFLSKHVLLDFPGGPVVKTSCFHCRGHMFDPCSGKFCMVCSVTKKDMHVLSSFNLF